jgi:hypothetical protein
MWYHDEPVIGLAAGLTFGLTSGLWQGFYVNPADRLAVGQDARRVIHDDLVACLMVGVGWGLMAAVVMGLSVGLQPGSGDIKPESMSGLTFGLMGGLVAGLLIMLAVWLGYGSGGRYATASLLFAFTETFPARPVQFLEWARNAGLLRVTGIAYQCRHDSYQQWLAAGGVDRGVKTTLDAQPADDLVEPAHLVFASSTGVAGTHPNSGLKDSP